jgi:hypothetical protein
MGKILWRLWFGLTFLSCFPSLADVAFPNCRFVVAADIQYDPANHSENDTFIFTLKRIGEDSSPLVLNKVWISRAKLETEIRKRAAALKKVQEPSSDRGILEDIDSLLLRSFRSKYLVIDFSDRLVKILREIDPKNAVAWEDVQKKLSQPDPTKP